MAWEQLDTKELDGRLQLIAGFLSLAVDNVVIVDLNCGHAPLLDWLHPSIWFEYIGNDTSKEAIDRCNAKKKAFTMFRQISDREFAKLLSGYVDVLLSLGYGPHLNEYESDTLDQSIVDIATEFKPQYVIIEAWSALPEKCRLNWVLSELQGVGYQVIYAWQLRPHVVTGEYQDRQVHVLECTK